MHEEVSTAFTNAISRSLPVAQELATRLLEPHVVWRKSGDQGWSGGYEQRPSFIAIFSQGRQDFDKIGAEFLQVFLRHHPNYNGRISLAGSVMSILRDPSWLLGHALVTLWQRHSSFQVGQAAIDSIVSEFADFVDKPAVPIRFLAQLLNFTMPVQTIEFPAGLRIRRLSEQEVSDIHGPVFQLGFSHRSGFGPQEFAVEGQYEEPKIIVGNTPADASPGYNQVRPLLDKAILAFRTFKAGRVGYDTIRLKAVKFCPLPLPGFGYGDLYVPFGVYNLAKDEIEPLREHAARIFAFSEPAIEMACSRLSDAQSRLRSQNQLVDGVIGLEALLLAGVSVEDRRELKYRFSLHYSTLFGTPEERHRAFRVAKDLYDLRSTVAHGGVLKHGQCRVGDEKLNIDEAAKRACEILRGVIHYFLPYADAAPYKKQQYWERRYFGLGTES